MIVPLRKRLGDGTPYTRRAGTEKLLEKLASMPRDELIERAKIRSSRHPDFIPSECLLYFVRQSKLDNSSRQFEALFRSLFARVEYAAVPPGSWHRTADGKPALSSTAVKIQEDVVERFFLRLTTDREGYDEGLDYFEINFADSIARLRSTARRKAQKEDNRRQPIELEDGEVSAEVERAARDFNPLDPSKLKDGNYRSRLLGAIKALPDDERHVVALLFKEYPIDSTDPNTPSICKILGCVEKTVRNRRDRAFTKLKQALSEDNLDG